MESRRKKNQETRHGGEEANTATNTEENEGETEDILMLDAVGDPAGHLVSQRPGAHGAERDDRGSKDPASAGPASAVRRGNQDGAPGAPDEGTRGPRREAGAGPMCTGGGDKDHEAEVSSSLPSPSGVREGAAWTMVRFHKDMNQGSASEESWGEMLRDKGKAGALLGAGESREEELIAQKNPANSQGNQSSHPIPNLNKQIRPLEMSNCNVGEGSDNLSLSLDLEGGSEGGGIRRRKEHVPAHLAPMVRAWLREQREKNGYLPSSPLRPRPPRSYDGTHGGQSRMRSIRFSPYHSVERLIEIAWPLDDRDPPPIPGYEANDS